ncbi:MAG: lipid-binding protein [Flavobacteriaceae bacterium]|nr:lipid-binding protein [Flavobacteriaceae bacterium]|tara:strand:- start:11699 stop:12304 length:606 start_codon:yes stop_codon:yes gene_type:complete
MKKLLYLIVAITTFACNTTTEKEEKKSDVAVQDTSLSFNLENSNIKWTGTELTSKTHYGSLKLTQADLVIVDSKITSGEFSVDMTSLSVEDLEGKSKERLEGHLSSNDFFSIEKFQTASLKILDSNSFENGSFKVNGELTIKDITRPIEFTIIKIGEDNYNAHLTFDRSKYDVKFRSGTFFENLGDKLILDDIDLDVNLSV